MSSTNVGGMLRDWREDRRRSQFDLALDVGVSTRHLSFVETGKSKPSPELVLALAEHLEVPLRERNTMLLAAGYAPRYPQTPLDADALATVRGALSELIRAHDPYPAVVVDRGWNIVMSNTGSQAFLDGVADHLVRTPATSYRITLHPEGMAPRVENFAEWAHHLLGTLDRQVAATRDPRLRDLLDEVSAYPNVAALDGTWRTRDGDPGRRRPAAAARRRRRAVVVLDEHVDRHAGRHHARRAPRRAVPPRRRGHGRARRRPHGLRPWRLSSAAMDATIAPAATVEEAAAIVAAVDALWPRPVLDGRRRPPPAAGVALQRAVVEPADPAAAGPPLGLTGTRSWPSS